MAFIILWLPSFCNQTRPAVDWQWPLHTATSKKIAKRQDYDEVISGGSLILPSPDWHQQLSSARPNRLSRQICFLLSNAVLLPTHNSSRTISSTYKNLQLLNPSGNK